MLPNVFKSAEFWRTLLLMWMLYLVITPFCSATFGGIQCRIIDEDEFVVARTFCGGPVGAEWRGKDDKKRELYYFLFCLLLKAFSDWPLISVKSSFPLKLSCIKMGQIRICVKQFDWILSKGSYKTSTRLWKKWQRWIQTSLSSFQSTHGNLSSCPTLG